MRSRSLWVSLILGSVVACSAAPQRAAEPAAEKPKAAAAVSDDCVQQPGKPPPKPLKRTYTGVAAKARCDREVYTIMGGVVHFLGVKCEYCHEVPDYPKMTHRKHIANWMARELIPSIEKRGGGDVWCNDCHAGRAKILKQPRDLGWAKEWMATHMTEEFDAQDGSPLRCKTCHGANVGSPEFKKKIILTENLPARGAFGRGQGDSKGDSGASGEPDATNDKPSVDAGADGHAP